MELDSKIYAVDFDGTLCENRYPSIGEPIQAVIDYVLARKSEGHKLILWTCRTDERLDEAVDWCGQQGITFDAVNENLPESIEEYGNDTRKVFADYYIDDSAITAESIIDGIVTQSQKSKAYGLYQARGGGEQLKKYYSLTTENREASVMIYGEITSWPWLESDVSSFTLSKEIDGLDVDVIHVYINSYGGEVAEALAIASALKRHKAKIITHDDGFACSAAADIFMAGDEREMSSASLLFIHHVWCYAAGNANQLRKSADDIEKMSKASMELYLGKVNITEEVLTQLFDEETWLLPQDALDMGFATAIVGEAKKAAANQSAKAKIIDAIRQKYGAKPNQKPVPDPEPQIPDEPEQNKPINFLNALFTGGKETT